MDQSSAEAARLLSSWRSHLAAAGQGSSVGLRAAELPEIDAALARIAAGTYGACEECGGAIGRDRLRALPLVRHCLGCAR